MKKAVFSGSFDPITKGHENIVLKALPLFDEIIVAIGYNIMKKNAYTLEQRMQWIKDVFADYPKVKVCSYQGLTVDFCKEVGVNFIIRGLRGPADLEYETLFFLTDPNLRCVSSTVVRDLLKHNTSIVEFVPSAICDDVTEASK